MEDPWANAWGDPSSKSPQATPPVTWKSPSLTPPLASKDQEVDIAAPSWSTGTEIKWDEPSDSAGSLWKRESLSISNPGWNPLTVSSPYDSIPLGNSPIQPHDPPLSPPQSVTDHSPPSPPQLPSFPQEVPSPLPFTSVPSMEEPGPEPEFGESSPNFPSHSTEENPEPGSPDAFGTFETAIQSDDIDVDPWTPAQPSFPSPEGNGTDAWAADAWNAPDSAATAREEDPQVDEWEAAKQQKEKLDRHVPPELLASILCQLEELSTDMWPTPTTSADTSPENSRQVDVAEAFGLSSVLNRLVPEDLSLPPIVQFSQTFTSKRTIETLRLTRHLPVTRASPMAFYLASKGSTSWEASVKSRPDVIEEDAAPVGWRLMEKKDEEILSADDGKKKPSGGLFSFFGKKSSALPETSTSTRTASPSRASVSSMPRSSAVATPRASIDSLKSGSKNPVGTGVASSTPSLKSPIVSSFNSPTTSKPQEHPDIFSPPTVPPLQVEEPRPATPPAPSAASRFLGRFSRSKSSISSPRDSVALSSDDIEFLSDIVPSASEVDNDDDISLGALTSMIQSSPLPTKLPPPLAPPSSSVSRQSKPPTDIDTFTSFLATPIQPSQSATVVPSMIPAPPKPSKQSMTLTSQQPVLRPAKVALSSPSASRPDKDDRWPAFDFDEPPSREVPVVSVQTPRINSTVRPQYPLIPRAQSPPVPPKRTFTAVMSNASTRNSSSAAIPKVHTFNLSVDPPSSHVPMTATTSIPFLPPPPSSRSNTPKIPTIITSQSHSPPPKLYTVSIEPSTTFDDDEFSDFLSSPAQPAAPSSFNSGFSLTHDNQHTPLTETQAEGPSFNSEFDYFDDFVSSSPRTPSPPKPPSKSPLTFSTALPPMLGSVSTPSHKKPKQPPPQKLSRATEHQRTMSLMETAAARGKWPAPPSPLPMAIPPPGVSSAPLTSNPEFDLKIEGPSQKTLNLMEAAAARGKWPAPPSPLPMAIPPPSAPSAPSQPDSGGSNQKTLDLMEKAAAHGKWPAPPSPLPMAIPPPGTHKQSNSDFDFLSGGSNMQQQQAKAMENLSSSVSSSADLTNGGMPQGKLYQAQGMETAISTLRTSSPSIHLLAPTSSSSWSQQSTQRAGGAASTRTAENTGGTGGLSAQDLSFFEGL